MLVRALPIRTTPVYGPVDTGRLSGMFVIRLSGEIGAQDVQAGNMVVVIGAVNGAASAWYWPLIQQTYCVNGPNIISPVS